MRNGFKGIFANAKQYVAYAKKDLAELKAETETDNLYRLWGSFLENYTSAAGAMMRATDQGPSKAWSDRMKHEQKSNPALQYAFHARNARHQHEVPRQPSGRSTVIGRNAIRISGNAKVYMKDNREIGPNGQVRMLPEGQFAFEDGRLISASKPSEFQELDHHIALQPVRDQSGNTYAVPNQDTPVDLRAAQLAETVLHWLEEKLSECEEMVKSETGKGT